jgi:hypothetical protein
MQLSNDHPQHIKLKQDEEEEGNFDIYALIKDTILNMKNRN